MESRGLWPVGQTPDIAINYREMAPAAVGPDFFEQLDADASTHGGKAVGVPGTVAGLLFALERYGTLGRRVVMAPAIRAAREGFVADQHYVDAVRETVADFEKHPEFKTRFASVWTRTLKEGKVSVGDRITNPEQARALELIAERGAAVFYEGPIAEAIVKAVAADGGPLTAADLRGFKVDRVDPLTFTWRGWTFLTMPPPSSGGVALAEAMGIMERLLPAPPPPPSFSSNVNQLNWLANAAYWNSASVRSFRDGVVYLQPLIESLRHAFADRSRWLGDPAFVDVPADRLLSAAYLDHLASTFKLGSTLPPESYGSPDPGASSPAPDDHGTSHLSVVDQWGSAVSCTETINLTFGSCLAVEPYGFILNDQMDDFTTRHGRANAFGLHQSERNLPAPGKRPLSSMTPTIVLNAAGSVAVVAGASGGPRIISATMQSILNTLVFRMSAGAAVDAPRLHDQWSPSSVLLEPPLMSTSADELRRIGYSVEEVKSIAAVQMITSGNLDGRPGGGWNAACDPRKGGRPAGSEP
jgi:gamma-glutamyltranspeptidase/glutathione hydrolase